MKAIDNKKIIHALCAGMITALLFAAVCFMCHIAPLGDNTFLMYDLKRQYIDYFSYYKSILSGDNTPFYSFSTALGSGMIGFEIYYISSPFLLILSLFPQSYLPIGVTVVICIKLMAASVIMDLFLQYYLGNKQMETTIGAVSWAFSSFLFAHSMNMMWIDVIILLPVLLWALDYVLLYNRKIWYCLMVSLLLFLNYYITYQVMIFIVMWSFFRVWTLEPLSPFKGLIRVFYMTFIGGIIDAIVLLPTALELMDSPKDITQLGLFTKGNQLSPIDVFSKLPTLSYDVIEARFGWPQIYCGVGISICLAIFFISRNISKKNKIGMGSMMLILLFSFMNDKLNLFWHAGMEPSGHPYRQAFLWIFLAILCGCEALSKTFITVSFKSYFIAIGIIGIIFGLSMNLRYDHISMLTIGVNISILAAYLVIFLIVSKNSKIRQCFIIIILLIQVAELTANACYTYRFQAQRCDKQSQYSELIDATQKSVNEIKDSDTTFYRMENLNPRQQNDSMQYGYNGITHYSSAGKTYVRYLLQRLGFNDDGLYTHYGHDNTVTMDMLLGVKYVLTDNTYEQHPVYKFLSEQLSKEGTVSINSFLNPYALSPAVKTNDFDYDGISCSCDEISSDNWDSYIPDMNPFELQEDMISRLTGGEINNIFESAIVQYDEYYEDENADNGNLVRDYIVTAKIDGELYMYMNGLIGSIQGMVIYVNDEMLTTYGNDACIKILNLGYLSEGDSVRLRIDGGSNSPNFGDVLFVTENITKVKEAYNMLDSNSIQISRISSSHLSMEVNDCDGVFLSIPSEKGWKVTADGKAVRPVCIYGGLSYIPVEDGFGKHSIDMHFIPEGFVLGSFISIIGLIALFIIILSEKNIVRIGKISILIFAVFAAFLLAYFDNEDRTGRLNANIKKRNITINDQVINVYEQDNNQYLFLPGFANEESSIFDIEEFSNINIMKGSNLNAVFITTNSGSLDNVYKDKENKEKGKIYIFDSEGECLLKDGLKYIKGHGNYTWNSEEWDKKSFGIEFKSGGKYTLISNATDPTLIRNDIARSIETKLNIPYVVNGEFIDLYVNGDYMGVYYLCQNFEIASGYLLEKEFYDRFKLEYLDNPKGVISKRGEPFIIKTPAICSDIENKYITEFLNNLEDNIDSGYENAGKYVDIDSFAKRYIVEEITKNYDAGVSSTYFYKELDANDNRLFYGPGWDYDMSLGNYLDWMEYYYEDATGMTYGISCQDANDWFRRLYKYDKFHSIICDNYEKKAKPYLLQLINTEIDDYRDKLADSVSMDQIRWKCMYDKCGYVVGNIDDYDNLKEFIMVRMQYLDGEWID